MLSPSDYNTAVPQFTNGNYASNPINPLYIEEPDATNYNRGAEPLQTLPAQWWNWFGNQFTLRFNKLNIYVKNLFNELAQLLSLGNITPDGTEATPTVEQLKGFFQCCYPEIVRDSSAISDTYVPQTTTVNGHALSGNVSVTGSDLGLGTSATVNTGTAQGCIPTVGTALGTTDGQFLATDSTGKLKPSGYTASCFRASTWTPTTVTNACKVWKCMATASTARNILLGEASESNGCGTVYVGNSCKATFNPGTGVLTANTFCGALSGNASTATSATCATSAKKIDRCSYTSAYNFDVLLTNGCTTATGTVPFVSGTCRLQFCNTTGVLTAKTFCGNVCGIAACATKDGAGCSFGTAARCAATAFRAGTWWPNSTSCGCVCLASCATNATCAFCADGPVHQYTWNGRSSCNTSYFCVCYDSSNGGQLCCWCNKMVDRMLIIGVRNGCNNILSVIIPPAANVNCTIQWMTCGTSCARVILF